MVIGAKFSEVFRKTSEGLGLSVPNIWEYEVEGIGWKNALSIHTLFAYFCA